MTPDQIERYVDATAAALRLPIAAAHRPGVIRYVTLAAAMADRLGADVLALDDEPAEAFVPVSPRTGGAR